MCGVAVKFGGLLLDKLFANKAVASESPSVFLFTRYILCVMDMLDCGDQSTEVHLLLLTALREGRIVNVYESSI